MIEHKFPHKWLTSPIRIHLIGCGGNGSQMLTNLAKIHLAMKGLGHPHGLQVTVFDPDRVSESNLGRQLFSPSDIGQFKSTILVTRINTFLGMDWTAEPTWFDRGRGTPNLFITCVDTLRARREIFQVIRGDAYCNPYWLDLGNEAHSGQFVMGNFRNARSPEKLPHFFNLYPKLNRGRITESNEPSCSLADALASQDLFINPTVATGAAQLLWRWFRDGQLDHHGGFVNLKLGRTSPLPIRHRLVDRPDGATPVRAKKKKVKSNANR